MTERATTLCEAFQSTVSRRGDAVALRTPGDAVRITYREYGERVRRIAAALAAIGVRHGDSVALMMTNRPEFNLCDTAAMHVGATAFSVYNTSPLDEIRYLFEHAKCRVVFCERQFLGKVQSASEGTAVSTIVVVDGDGAQSLAAFEGKGAADFDFEASWRRVRPDDVLTLIYTSGTTGRPKGVELTHANILAELDCTHAVLPVVDGDRITSYLPSAHVADRWSAHYLAMLYAVTVTCVADARMIGAALVDSRPTIWGAVPRVWEKLKAGLEAAFAMEQDEQKKQAVAWALSVGQRKVRAEQAALLGQGAPPDDALRAEHQKAEALVLSAIRKRIGLDQLRWAVSGAAPIAVDVLEFFCAIGIPVCELWGMSELSCCATVNPLDGIRLGTVGPRAPRHRAPRRRGRRAPRAWRDGDEGVSQRAREDRRDDRRRRMAAHGRHRIDRRRRLRAYRRSQEGANHQRGREEHVAREHRERAQVGAPPDRTSGLHR